MLPHQTVGSLPYLPFIAGKIGSAKEMADIQHAMPGVEKLLGHTGPYQRAASEEAN